MSISRIPYLCITLALFILITAACGQASTPITRPPAAVPAIPAPTLAAPPALTASPSLPVKITDGAFDPPRQEIPVGTTVTWTNLGSTPHTVTSGQARFDSGPLAPGQSFSFTFLERGEYAYACSLHPAQVGVIVVR